MSLSNGEIQDIRDLAGKFPGYIMQQNFEALSHLYSVDAVLMPPGQAEVTGRADIQQWMAAFPPVSVFDMEIDEIDGRDDLAYIRGRYRMVMQPEGAPEPIEDKGKYLEVRKKQADGSWPMAVDIFNSDG